MTKKLPQLAGPVHVVGGLLLFATGFLPAVQDALIALLPVAPDFQWSTFFVAVFGPTIASWGVLFAALVNQFYAAPTPAIWRSMLIAVLIWAPLDTALCIYYGFWIGVIINLGVFCGLLTLLIVARHEIT